MRRDEHDEGALPAGESGARRGHGDNRRADDPRGRRPRGWETAGRERLRVAIRGAVQGVGFRPFVYRLARELELGGWVANDARGVAIEVEGAAAALATFLERLGAERPAPAVVHATETLRLAPLGESGFRIAASDRAAARSAVILPDLATCPDCRRELFDPADRRHAYPFINCTHCGPRFTILEELPYDRPRTTMRGFEMCPDCRAEYGDPLDRRFHAQPDACPACGPRLALTDARGHRLAGDGAALAAAVAALRRGEIVALKGLGGFQLLVDARDEAAVARLRARKRRPAKPLAVLVRDLDAARRLAVVTEAEARLLASREAPIVLLDRRADADLAAGVAPGNPRVGVMLPTTPLHHLLAAGLDFPLIATSGNLTDEPIAIDDGEAVARLGGVADLFLGHDRPIARHVDDSVAQVLDGAPQLLRRARGWAPLPVLVRDDGPVVVAVGAHQKDVAALAAGRQVFLSQHLGDMETPQALAAFERVILDFVRVYEARPERIARDLHPDYPTTRWALAAARAEGGLLARCGHPPGPLPVQAVQHHHAHLASALAEHGEPGPALGVTWDGTGYGPDGTVWGGEFLLGDAAGFERVARLRPFRLAGGEAAVREPRRVALALVAEVEGAGALARRGGELGFAPGELPTLARLLAGGFASPLASSAGRLFDGIAALAGLPGRVSFEGEAAIALEAAAGARRADPYPLPLAEAAAPAGLAPGQRPRAALLELDWRPLVAAVLEDRDRGAPAERVAARFHAALVEGALAVARAAGAPRVALTGGCFQNRRLTLDLAARLGAAGHQVLLQRSVPANDGGIALGQVAVARALARAGA